MSGDDIRVQVKIGGRTYTLRGNHDAESVKELAAYVDARMTEIGDQISTVDTTRIAILTALNIADELFQSQQSPGTAKGPGGSVVRDKRLCRLLDDVLAA